jgi:hypothetical protein
MQMQRFRAQPLPHAHHTAHSRHKKILIRDDDGWWLDSIPSATMTLPNE